MRRFKMVKTTESFSCDICGVLYYSEKQALECERIHKEGIIVKEYLHNNSMVTEIMEHYENSGHPITEIQAELISSVLYEVEIDIKLMDDSAEIIDIKKEKAVLKDLR
jgi:hypothetical protein